MDKKQIEGILYAGIGVAVGLLIYEFLKPKLGSMLGSTKHNDDDIDGNFEEDLY